MKSITFMTSPETWSFNESLDLSIDIILITDFKKELRTKKLVVAYEA